MWHTLLDDPTSYLESSATGRLRPSQGLSAIPPLTHLYPAGFSYAILLALRLDLIPGDLIAQYRKVALRGLDAVVANIDDEGQLQNCSFGTAMGSNLDHYRTVYITPMPYGSAMAMCALGEYLRTYL